MRILTVTENEAGQRLDKLLGKYLDQAPKSFLYKMLRKKNITLNGKKAAGSEKTITGDEIRLFLSEETMESFTAKARPKVTGVKLDIIYEDEHILLVNKPGGMLSQKAKPEDISLVEHVISYLLTSGAITEEGLRSFRPSICNRLDRNTSGIVVAGKSLSGLQTMAEVFRERSLHKYYRCIVKGSLKTPREISGYLVKDASRNQVTVSEDPLSGDALPIRTSYQPLSQGDGVTLLEVKLITGRSHQIRAHLASIGHPILGDAKYGDGRVNEQYRREYGLTSQLLHSFRLELPELTGPLSYLSGRSFTAQPPKLFLRIMEERC